MFDTRQLPNRRNTFAASTAVIIFSGILVSPVFAAPSARITCPEATQATLDVPLRVFATEFIIDDDRTASVAADDAIETLELASSSNPLAPRAEAAIRKAFGLSNLEPIAGTDSESRTVPDGDESAETDPGMNTRLPGVSDNDFLRYRKQMYRRDI